jgi:hypothetical protein
VSIILQTGNDPPTPSAPTPSPPLHLPDEELAHLLLIPELRHARPDLHHPDQLPLHHAPDALDLMPRVPGPHLAVRQAARPAAAGTRRRAHAARDAVELARVLGIAVRLLLDLVGDDALAPAAARHAPIPLADADAQAAERREVPRAPLPDALVFRVGAAEAAAAGLAEPDTGAGTGADDLLQGLGADGRGRGGRVRVEGWVDEQGERYAGAGLADASMAVTEKDWSRRFDCAILDMVVSTYVPKLRIIELYDMQHSLDKQSSHSAYIPPPYLERNYQPCQPLRHPVRALGSTSLQHGPCI